MEAEEKPKPRRRRCGVGMRWTALSKGARGESREQRERSDAEAWRDEVNELKEPWRRLEGGARMAALDLTYGEEPRKKQ